MSSRSPEQRALIEARALVAKPEAWAKITEFGMGKYCMLQALSVVTGMNYTAYLRAYRILTQVCGGIPSVWQDRDDVTHEMVLNAFDRAIALA